MIVGGDVGSGHEDPLFLSPGLDLSICWRFLRSQNERRRAQNQRGTNGLKSRFPDKCETWIGLIRGGRALESLLNGESVREAAAEKGHPLLRKAAEDNARTWKFVAHTPGTFHATFRYKEPSGDADVEFLESPSIVQMEVATPEMSIYYAWLGLGTWKAQLKSAHGKSSQVLRLYYSGPNGDWLDGNAVSREGESEEIDFGHKKETF